MMENPSKMDDLGVPLFLETPTYEYPSFFRGYVKLRGCISFIYKTFGFTACFFPARSWRRQWQRQWQLKVAMMVNFIEGNIEGID